MRYLCAYFYPKSCSHLAFSTHIKLRDVYSKRSNIFLVLELCHFDVEVSCSKINLSLCLSNTTVFFSCLLRPFFINHPVILYTAIFISCCLPLPPFLSFIQTYTAMLFPSFVNQGFSYS